MKPRKSRPGNRLAVLSGVSLLFAIAVLFRPSGLANQSILTTTSTILSEQTRTDALRERNFEERQGGKDNGGSSTSKSSLADDDDYEQGRRDNLVDKNDANSTPAVAEQPPQLLDKNNDNFIDDDDRTFDKKAKSETTSKAALYNNDYDYSDPSSSRSSSTSSPTTTTSPATAASTKQQSKQPPQQVNSKIKIPRLSKHLAHKYSRNNVIIVTWANLHFSDFVLNWVFHVQRHGIQNFLVGAMDEETATFLHDSGVENIFAMYEKDSTDTGLTTADFGWGSATFHKMGRQKVDLAAMFTSFGLDLCLCDVDTVWINDPTEYFNSFPQADILASSDLLNPTQPPGDDGLEAWEAVFSPMNIGLLFFRHSNRVEKFIHAWSDMLEADEKVWDQDAFNKLAHCNGSISQDDVFDRLAWGFNESVSFGVLPVASFASGHTYFVQNMYERQRLKPFVVHTTYQFGGSAGKRHRLREAVLWQDPPEYYSKGQFLEVSIPKPTIPREYSVFSGLAMTKFHLKAIAEQLAEVKYAMAIAVALNRTLIMPTLYCFCDKYWGVQEHCRPPGSANYSMPFVCPLDHIMIPEQISAGDVDDATTMKGVDFREYSFLDNPNVPKAILESSVEVEADWSLDQRDSGLDSSSSNSDSGATQLDKKASVENVFPLVAKEKRNKQGKLKLIIPGKLTDVQLKQLLGSSTSNNSNTAYGNIPLLRLKGSPSSIFAGFQDVAEDRRFLSRFRRALDIWCCFKTPEESMDPVHRFADDFPLENDTLLSGGGIVV